MGVSPSGKRALAMFCFVLLFWLFLQPYTGLSGTCAVLSHRDEMRLLHSTQGLTTHPMHGCFLSIHIRGLANCLPNLPESPNFMGPIYTTSLTQQAQLGIWDHPTTPFQASTLTQLQQERLQNPHQEQSLEASGIISCLVTVHNPVCSQQWVTHSKCKSKM